MAEIVDIERFRMDLVHGACGVCHSCNFVSIEFFPIRGLSFTIAEAIGHHFGFQRLRFLKSRCVSIAALLPRPEGIGDSLYRFNLEEIVSHGIPMGGSPLATLVTPGDNQEKCFIGRKKFTNITEP